MILLRWRNQQEKTTAAAAARRAAAPTPDTSSTAGQCCRLLLLSTVSTSRGVSTAELLLFPAYKRVYGRELWVFAAHLLQLPWYISARTIISHWNVLLLTSSKIGWRPFLCAGWNFEAYCKRKAHLQSSDITQLAKLSINYQAFKINRSSLHLTFL